MTQRKVSEPTQDEYGYDIHPAFGLIQAHRISSAPGAVLFDSDIRHEYFMRVTIFEAHRKRDHHHDRSHTGRVLMEVDMSEAQWASFVSSPNTYGVPCTITARSDDYFVDSLPFQPRLQESMREVHGAAEQAFAKIKEARDAYEALPNTPAKPKKEALSTLHWAIEHATSNVDFAAKSLGEHVENVVQRARNDIETMMVNKAQQMGLTPGQLGVTLELEAGDSDA
jgi:hypothetical protein